jgi:hypothetical protein
MKGMKHCRNPLEIVVAAGREKKTRTVTTTAIQNLVYHLNPNSEETSMP